MRSSISFRIQDAADELLHQAQAVALIAARLHKENSLIDYDSPSLASHERSLADAVSDLRRLTDPANSLITRNVEAIQKLIQENK